MSQMMLNAFSSKTRFVIRYALGCWASLWLGLPAMGEFPEKPITVIVPFAAGGGSDVFVRIFQQAIRENNLSPHPIVVKNVSGAGGTIGSRTAREADRLVDKLFDLAVRQCALKGVDQLALV